MPWIVFRDFSNALNPKDKKGGPPIPFSYLIGFKNCILQCGLAECNLQGANLHGGREGWQAI